MKEKLHALIDSMSENEIIYALTLLSKLFGRGGAAPHVNPSLFRRRRAHWFHRRMALPHPLQ